MKKPTKITTSITTDSGVRREWAIRQAAATMALAGMPLSVNDMVNLRRIAMQENPDFNKEIMAIKAKALSL